MSTNTNKAENIYRHIFDSTKGNYRDKTDALKMAHKAGYKFAIWNGDLLFIANDIHSDGDDFIAYLTGIQAESIGY